VYRKGLGKGKLWNWQKPPVFFLGAAGFAGNRRKGLFLWGLGRIFRGEAEFFCFGLSEKGGPGGRMSS
jgi:hypothetical protein